MVAFYFFFLLTNFTVAIIIKTKIKKPRISCHQNVMTIDFKITVNTTRKRINVAISFDCRSLMLEIGSDAP